MNTNVPPAGGLGWDPGPARGGGVSPEPGSKSGGPRAGNGPGQGQRSGESGLCSLPVAVHTPHTPSRRGRGVLTTITVSTFSSP